MRQISKYSNSKEKTKKERERKSEIKYTVMRNLQLLYVSKEQIFTKNAQIES